MKYLLFSQGIKIFFKSEPLKNRYCLSLAAILVHIWKKFFFLRFPKIMWLFDLDTDLDPNLDLDPDLTADLDPDPDPYPYSIIPDPHPWYLPARLIVYIR